VLNEVEGKLIEVDFQIKQTTDEIAAAKNIDKNQLKMIRKAESELNNVELKELKSEVEKLRNKLKNDNKVERKKTHRERVLQ
jgi:type II secretory pathway component HofQ